jgi:protein-tyrosine phosphatase
MPFLLIGLLTFGGAAALLGVLSVRRKRLRYPHPASLMIEPEVDVLVSHAENGDFEIRWKPDAETVRIYGGTQPDAIDRSAPLMEVVSEKQAVISGLDPTIRYYFELVFDSDRRYIVAERILPLDGAPNFRDLGGYRTVDGQHMRWGRVFRSGILHRLTESDLRYLQQIGLRLVCDLRSLEEIQLDPDRMPESTNHVHIPIYADRDATRRLRALLFNPNRLAPLLLEAYTRMMIDDNAAAIGSILRKLADEENLPAVIHCTAGKDRTGVTTAILLLALGVPEEVIVADYSLSNLYFDDYREIVREFVKPLRRLGITVDDMHLLLLAQPEMIRAALRHIEERYGSVDSYLRDKAGIDADVIAQLKANLLE